MSLAAPRLGRSGSSDRFAVWLRRLRWPVLIVWLVVGVLLFSFAHNLSDVTSSSASANIPASAPSTRVLLLQQAAQRGQLDSDQATVVFARSQGLTAADLAADAPAVRRVAAP